MSESNTRFTCCLYRAYFPFRLAICRAKSARLSVRLSTFGPLTRYFYRMAKPSKKLFLLDALALIYRAHFAFSKAPRISSRGINTSAVFGFMNAMIEVLTKEKPTHIGVAFDSSKKTFRHEKFPMYKATRQSQPEDISIAMPYIKQIVEAMHIPMLILDGYEADDIIGTIAKKSGSC